MKLQEILTKETISIRNKEDLEFCLNPRLEYDFKYFKNSYKYITIIDKTIISLNTRMINVLVSNGVTVFNADCYPAHELTIANNRPAYIYESNEKLDCGYTGKHICFITDDEDIEDYPVYKAYNYLWTFIDDLPKLINVKGSVNV